MNADWEQKTKRLKQYFDNKKRPYMRCQAINDKERCENRMSSQKMWANIKEVLEFKKRNNDTHLIEEFDKKDDVFYHHCPRCGGGADFA
jgi:hypothetical protein